MKPKKFLVIFGALICMPFIAVLVLSLTNSFKVRVLKVYGEVPPFQLTERSGSPLSREDLKGKVWVASFIFTHCAGQCPLLCNQIKELQKKLRHRSQVRLVSITVDPARDSAPVLAEYASRYEADPKKWFFLTGEQKQIEKLVQHGFRLPSESSGPSNLIQVSHSFKLVLIDDSARIRGYYDGLDEKTTGTLVADVKQLLRESHSTGF